MFGTDAPRELTEAFDNYGMSVGKITVAVAVGVGSGLAARILASGGELTTAILLQLISIAVGSATAMIPAGITAHIASAFNLPTIDPTIATPLTAASREGLYALTAAITYGADRSTAAAAFMLASTVGTALRTSGMDTALRRFW